MKCGIIFVKQLFLTLICLAGHEMWARFISEGKPVEGAPELFEFDGVRCNQPFYDEDKVCEVRVVESGKLLYSKLFFFCISLTHARHTHAHTSVSLHVSLGSSPNLPFTSLLRCTSRCPIAAGVCALRCACQSRCPARVLLKPPRSPPIATGRFQHRPHIRGSAGAGASQPVYLSPNSSNSHSSSNDRSHAVASVVLIVILPFVVITVDTRQSCVRGGAPIAPPAHQQHTRCLHH